MEVLLSPFSLAEYGENYNHTTVCVIVTLGLLDDTGQMTTARVGSAVAKIVLVVVRAPYPAVKATSRSKVQNSSSQKFQLLKPDGRRRGGLCFTF